MLFIFPTDFILFSKLANKIFTIFWHFNENFITNGFQNIQSKKADIKLLLCLITRYDSHIWFLCLTLSIISYINLGSYLLSNSSSFKAWNLIYEQLWKLNKSPVSLFNTNLKNVIERFSVCYYLFQYFFCKIFFAHADIEVTI